MGASFIDVFEVNPACSSFTSMTFLTPCQNKLGSLQMAQLHTQWWPALMTRPNYNETSTSLLSGRKDGIWPTTQRSAPHCQWPAAGNPGNTSTNYVVTQDDSGGCQQSQVLGCYHQQGHELEWVHQQRVHKSQQDPRLPQEKPED